MILLIINSKKANQNQNESKFEMDWAQICVSWKDAQYK